MSTFLMNTHTNSFCHKYFIAHKHTSYIDSNSTPRHKAHNKLWSINQGLIFHIHVLARLDHHQGEHVKYKTEVT